MSQLSKGYTIGIVGVVIWSTTGILISYLITHYGLPPLLLSFWRNLLVCAVLLPALFAVRRSLIGAGWAHLRFYAFYGLILALFNSIWTLSVQANGAAVATVLGYSSVGFTAILAYWLLHETLHLPKIIAVILSIVGCVLVSNAYDPAMWNLNPLGVSTGIITGILFACYNLMGKQAARRHLNVWTSLLYSFAFSTLFTGVFNLLPFIPGTAGAFSALVPQLPPDGWLVLVVLSFGPTVLGFGLYNTSMNYLPASTASLIASTEPALTAVEAYLFLNERMTLVQIIGSLIILSALVVVRYEKD